MPRQALRISLLVLLALSFTSTLHADQSASAQVAGKAWLSKLDSGDYSGTWDAAASIFKTALSSQAWQQASQTVRTPLGAVRQRTELSSVPTKTLPGVPDGDYVVMQFTTQFEFKAQAIETVVMTLDKDGSWKVAGYFVR